jgi:uncharacterized protein YbaP (TraB family)
MKTSITIRRLLTAAAICLAQPALAQSEAAPAATPAASEGADADPALWVVRDADTTIYLFGTIHLLRPGLSWFDEAVREAFDASDELKVEVVMPADPTSLAQAFTAAGTYPEGVTLQSRMTEEQRAAYRAAIAPTGIPPEAIDSLEPWFSGLQLALAIYAQMGFQPGAGAEAVLKEAAGSAGKPVSGFETVEEQITFLDSTPESEQIAGLIQFFERGREMPAYVERLLASWTSGSPDDTAAIMNEAMATSPETARILLTDRNRRWADTLKARMDQPGTVFVAVGAGHLAGEGSVQQFLAEHGHTAERIAY